MKKIITLAAVLFAAMISANSFAQIRWSATALVPTMVSMPVSLAKCRLRAFRTWGSKVA